MIVQLLVLTILYASLMLVGCGESKANYVSSDYRYYETDMPLLAVSKDHYGGGVMISESMRNFPYGMDIDNLSEYGIAESLRIRIRVYVKDMIVDDHLIQIGDVFPKTQQHIEGVIEVPSNYTGTDVILTYQIDSKIIKQDLKTNQYFLEDVEKLSYFSEKIIEKKR
jgi:hypothetical protein